MDEPPVLRYEATVQTRTAREAIDIVKSRAALAYGAQFGGVVVVSVLATEVPRAGDRSALQFEIKTEVKRGEGCER